MKNNKSDLLEKLEKLFQSKINKKQNKNYNESLKNKSHRILINTNQNNIKNKIKINLISNNSPFRKRANKITKNKSNIDTMSNKKIYKIKTADNSITRPIKNKINKGIFQNIFNRNNKNYKLNNIYSENRHSFHNYNNNYKDFSINYDFDKTINANIIDEFTNKTLSIEMPRDKNINYNKYFLPYKTIYNPRNSINLNKDKNHNFYKRTCDNFYNQNLRNNIIISNSNSMKSYKENLCQENIYKTENYNNNRNKMINNNMTINIDNIQNNYLQNRGYKFILNNKINIDNISFNEKLFMRYKYNIMKIFIKYINRYILLFFKKDKKMFFMNLKEIYLKKKEKDLFLKGIRKNLINNTYYNTSYVFKKYNLTDRNNSSNLSYKKQDNSLQKSIDNNFININNNNFLNYNNKKKKFLIDLEIKNNIGKFNDISTLTEEENSKKISISISSNENINTNNNNKTINNNSISNKNIFINKSNKLIMKLKETNKINDYVDKNN